MKKFPNPCQTDWIGHPNSATSQEEKYLSEHQSQIEILGQWEDPNLSWEYHEIALIRLINDVTGELCYYALTTSGCSCPSPQETWSIDFGPATLDELREWCEKAPQATDLCPFLTNEALREGNA